MIGSEQDFLRWEAASRDVIDVKRVYIDIAGDLVAGILLSQIVYWWLPTRSGDSKLRITRNGEQWLAKGREDWWEECRITPKQFDRAVEILAEKRFVRKEVFRYEGLTRVHLSLNLPGIAQAVKAELPKGQFRNSPEGKSEVPQTVNPINKETETTPETTGRGSVPSRPVPDTPHHRLFAAYEAALGYGMTKEQRKQAAAGCKLLLEAGYTQEEILACYHAVKTERDDDGTVFWAKKHLTLQSIYSRIGPWKASKQGEQRPQSDTSGPGNPSILDRSPNERYITDADISPEWLARYRKQQADAEARFEEKCRREPSPLNSPNAAALLSALGKTGGKPGGKPAGPLPVEAENSLTH